MRNYVKFATFVVLSAGVFGCSTPKMNPSVSLGTDTTQDNVASTINLSLQASYYDEKVIKQNILSTCTELGTKLSESTKEILEKYGFSVLLKPDIAKSDEGENLILQITSVISFGNAFIGHTKSVSMEAELYENGELIDTFLGGRDCGGGISGGFKSSCGVLERCVNVLGKDVANWINSMK